MVKTKILRFWLLVEDEGVGEELLEAGHVAGGQQLEVRTPGTHEILGGEGWCVMTHSPSPDFAFPFHVSQMLFH